MDALSEILKSLIPVFTLLIGAGLTYSLGLKSKKDESALKYKEEQYAKLLIKLQGFVGVTANGKTKRDFFEEQYKSWLYCSDEVVEAMNQMVRLIIENRDGPPDRQKGIEAVGNIVVAMRNDLHGNTKLNYSAFQYIDVLD